MTKAQRQVLLDMFNKKTYLKRKGDTVWCFSHDGAVSIRQSTVSALMLAGYVTQGFDTASLTDAGRKVAINGSAAVN